MNATRHPFRLVATSLALSMLVVFAPNLAAQQPTNQANYALAKKYSAEFINQFVHSTSVTPNWIGETDEFWYEFTTTAGRKYWIVNPTTATKKPLFDHDYLAELISAETQMPVEAPLIQLGSAKMDDKGELLTFIVEKTKFEYNLLTESLKNTGEASEDEARAAAASGNRGGRRGGRRGGQVNTTASSDDEETPGEHRSFSPDKTAYVFAQSHNLYFIEAPESAKAEVAAIDARMKEEEEAKAEESGSDKISVDDDDSKTENGDDEEKKDDRDEREKWADAIDESQAVALSIDGEKKYSFTSTGRGTNQEDEEDKDKKTRVNVSWSEDSASFYVTRRDSRGVADLYLVNALSEPRPTLEQYSYAMPGEEDVATSDLNIFDRDSATMFKVEGKWKDENYRTPHYRGSGDEIRFIRQDRLLRNIELVALDTNTGAETILLTEGFEKGLLSTQNVRYLEDRDEFLWWSERSGWGHYYLYGLDGDLKNRVTSGAFRASAIVEVDEGKGILYFTGNGHEKGENVYNNHLYRVFLDGTGLTLLDPGDANHRSTLSPTQNFLVDNYNRVDLPPSTKLRDATGAVVLDLESTDLSELAQTGWKLPETFEVKAADGITTLYGNMWKPFDFDPSKKYPIILYQYPGPQQEGLSSSFSVTGGERQELAQIGFIVIEVGHRGGTPGRSKAYHIYSYWNMRDFALADTKAAIEKLAARHGFIDIDRVGLYGHSGGGFFTATALLQKPYNTFFKVGVSSSGNHDNNVYNNSWSERYHGLKEVEVEEEEKDDADKSITDSNGTNGSQNGQDGEQDKEVEKKTKYEIHIPTNAELAENLEGHLLLVHGDMDNNVHPAGTIRLVDALIKANKRFDMLMIPGARHGFGAATGYFKQRKFEYFAEHLLGDYQPNADILDKSNSKSKR